jgi:hypothetical protein
MKEIIPVSRDSRIYNAADAPGHERGFMGKDKPKHARIYSVYSISKGMAHCQSWDAWGNLFNEVFPVNTLIPFKKKN